MFSKITPQLARVLLLLSILFLLIVPSAFSQSEKGGAGKDSEKGSTDKSNGDAERGSKGFDRDKADKEKPDHTTYNENDFETSVVEGKAPNDKPDREGGGNSDPSTNKGKSKSITEKGKQAAKKNSPKWTIKYLIQKFFGWKPSIHPIDYFYPEPMADDQKQDLLPVRSIEKLGGIYETLTPEEEADLNDLWEKAIEGDKKAAEILVKEIDGLYDKRSGIQKKSRSDEKNLVLPEPSRKRYRKLPDQP